ncbi:helix-turn-helix domain-containing protein [Enterococcus casseliflavus]|uniref:helix-turn-helix domain-containing protein n=1 Tax=Enterococcus casseliflavus TaxID=37734 RepID=UPI002890C1DD|nr:HTH domain-containing protein [Enterococcus casseliflavus]MDT2991030.1 HTH domain-containing protein [Enterococcus casseliflavus]
MNQSNVSIKELADELEVSKTAIRKHVNQLPEEFVVVDTGKRLELPPETAQYIRDKVITNRMKVTSNATGRILGEVSINLPEKQFPTDETISFLMEQIETKDKQLETKDTIIKELTASLRDQQRLSTLQLEKQERLLLENEQLKSKKPWWKLWK